MIREIIWLRAIACIAVVLVHSLSWTIANSQETMPGTIGLGLSAMQTALMFGTPTFVFISEFLISRTQPKSSKDFLTKRLKFILLPYLTMSIFYAFLETSALGVEFAPHFYIEVLKNFFLGDFHGYFILIIFQFYILHLIFVKYLSKLSAKLVLGITLLINVVYLAFFNFVEPFQFPHARYIWYYVSTLPFLGWLFYFTFAYYCGKNVDVFLKYLNKYTWIVFLAPVITFGIVSFNRYFMILDLASSKRVDILFYTISIICLLYYLTSKIKHIPNVIVLISQYSFGIYLLHPFVQLMIPDISMHYALRLPFSFLINILGSMAIIYVVNKFPFGKYLVGKIGKPYEERVSSRKVKTVEST